MPSLTNNSDIINPISLVIPNLTTTAIELLVVEAGTLVYDITKSKLSVCVTARTVGAAAWEDITSA